MRVAYSIVFVSDMERTVAFYRDVVGMPVKFETPGWTEFATEGVGNVMHIALEITRQRYAEVKSRLDKEGVAYEEVGGSLYVRDPNRLNLELLVMD